MPIDTSGQPLWNTSGTPPYTDARPVTADQVLPAPGRGVFIATTAAGNVRLRLAGGTFLVVPAAVGPTLIDNIAAVGFTSAGTTATATVSVLV